MFKLWYSRQSCYKDLIVNNNTHLVIEGFPRCANTFAVVAFQQAQHETINIAHHMHSEVQVVLGVKYKIPVLVLCREPAHAIASLVTRHPHISVGQALRRYCLFYNTVFDYYQSVVFADFSQVTNDYASVINRLNFRYSSEFCPYINSEASDKKIFDKIDELNEMAEGGKRNMLARPDIDKAKLLETRVMEVMSHPYIAQAQKLYSKIRKLTTI